MKKEFRVPELEVTPFVIENIVLTSGIVPSESNLNKAKSLLADENIDVNLQAFITF